MVGFEERGDAMLLHNRLRPRDTLVAHALGVETLLPIGCFRTERQLRCVWNHVALQNIGNGHAARTWISNEPRDRAALFRDPAGCTLPVARIGAPTIGFTSYDGEEP